MALTVISLKWVHREIHGKPPSPRQGHTACIIGDVAYIFGGIRSVDWPKKGTYFFRDLHQLHLYKRMQWEKVRQKGDIPKGRYGHHMCVVGQKIFLFGGKHELQADQCLLGIHVFDTEDRTWSELQTSGTEPVAHSSTSAVVGKRIYTFGGLVEGQAVDDLYCFDTDSRWWVKLTVTGVPPSPRCDTACTAVDKKLYFFGGTGGPDLWFNDLHVFDTDKLLWTHLNRVEGDPPPARGSHSFVAHADKDIYIFGGTNDSNTSQQTYGDLYKLSLDKHKWKRPFYGGCPPAKRSGHASIIHKNKLVIIGGSNEDTDFNDVHIAKLINPSKRQPLKVSANDMHEFLSSIHSPEPATQAPPSSDPSDGHFHEKPEPEPAPDELNSLADSNESAGALQPSVDNEGSIASVGSSLSQGGTGKTVHFKDEEDDDEKQDSARSSSSSSSTASSATSLSSQASTSTEDTDPDEGSPGSNNNNNNMNNNNPRDVAPAPRAFKREDDGNKFWDGRNDDEGVAGSKLGSNRHGVDKEVQVTSLDTSDDTGGITTSLGKTEQKSWKEKGSESPLAAEIPAPYGIHQSPMPPEMMATHSNPMSGYPQQGHRVEWRPPPPLSRGSTVSDFRFMQGQFPMAVQVQGYGAREEEEEEEEENSGSGSDSDGEDASLTEASKDEQRSNSVQETESDDGDNSESESDSDEEDDDSDEEEDEDDDEEEEEESSDNTGSDSSDESD